MNQHHIMIYFNEKASAISEKLLIALAFFMEIC